MLQTMNTTNDNHVSPVVLVVEPDERDRELWSMARACRNNPNQLPTTKSPNIPSGADQVPQSQSRTAIAAVECQVDVKEARTW